MPQTAEAPVNGQSLPRDQVEGALTEKLTEGYRPSLPLWALWNDASYMPQVYILRDIELMDIHPVCRSVMNYYKRGSHGAEFWGGKSPDGNPAGLPLCAESPEVDVFCREMCEKYWSVGVPKVQNGYLYGWLGLESLYSSDEGRLTWEGLADFSPRDTFLLTQASRPVGVRVKQVGENRGDVDLWTASPDVPAKGLWYAHEPRYSSHYGQSQYLGAWRPWRRLAWKDSAETILDTGVYRYGIPTVYVKYPDEDYQAQVGAPYTSLDSQGRPRRYARDMARMIAEQLKAGAGMGVSSAPYPPDMGGKPKWEVEQLAFQLNVEQLVGYCKFLHDQICYGIGVPPELLAAGETGTGYSGRSIPLEAFLSGQQRLADAMLDLFVKQVLIPLVRWNFGVLKNGKVVAPKLTIKVKPLLQTKREQAVPQPPMPQGQPGAQPGQPAAPGAPPGGQPGSEWMGPQADEGGAPMSLEDHRRTERVRRLARLALGIAA